MTALVNTTAALDSNIGTDALEVISSVDELRRHLFIAFEGKAGEAVNANAKLTLYSKATDKRMTFRLKMHRVRTEAGGFALPRKGADAISCDVSVPGEGGMAGGQWKTIGYLAQSKRGGPIVFRHEARYRWQQQLIAAAPKVAVKAFRWLYDLANSGRYAMPSNALVWRQSCCSRCGKHLNSEFRLIGFGPVCCKHLDIDAPACFAVAAMTCESQRVEAVRDLIYSDASKQTLGVIKRRVAGPDSVTRSYIEQAA